MEKVINICFSESARGTLKQAIIKNKLGRKEKVIALIDNISQGPIRDVINVEERVNWWNELNGEDKYYYCEIDDLKENYNKFYKEISEISNTDTIYFWYGQCSKEICGMMYTLQLLKSKSPNMYFINISDMIIEYTHHIFVPKSVGQIMTEKLREYTKLARKIDSKEYEDLLNQWETLKKENSILRVFIDGKVRSVGEDYFDIDILKYSEKKLKKSARIVGTVLGYSETEISDDYIFWRVKELAKSGKLKYQGKFGVMREMEICITEEGLKYLSSNAEAMEFWNKREHELQEKTELINNAKAQGRMEEKIRIARNLLDVLDVKTIAVKIGLTEGQIRNLI